MPDQIVQLLPIIAFALIFWLLLVRPAQRRRKHIAAMQSSLAVGDNVMLSSGVFGTIRGLAEDHVELEVAAGVTLRVARGAVAEVVSAASHAASAEPAPAEPRPGEPAPADPASES
ncbi:MAG: preprotein translocase subunit YajC [Nocardioides sp.]